MRTFIILSEKEIQRLVENKHLALRLHPTGDIAVILSEKCYADYKAGEYSVEDNMPGSGNLVKRSDVNAT